MVDKLLNLTSNYVQDETSTVQTPAKLFAEFQEIWAIVTKVRALEEQYNMTRRLREASRHVHMQNFLQWVTEMQGAKIKNLRVKDFGPDRGTTNLFSLCFVSQNFNQTCCLTKEYIFENKFKVKT